MTTTATKPAPRTDQCSLREAGKRDHENGVRLKLTGWGKVCAAGPHTPRGRRRKERTA